MANQVIAVVPSKEKHVFCMESKGESKEFKKPAQAIVWLRKRRDGDNLIVLGVMGGPGQDFFGKILEIGIPVQRIPTFQIQAITALEPKATIQDRAVALQLSWEEKPELFYPLQELDQTVVMIRELTRQRLNIQEFRKMATLQLHSALRSLEFVLPEEAVGVVELLRKGLKDLFRQPELRDQIEAEFSRLETEVKLSDYQQSQIFAIRRFFSNPRFVLGAKEDEQELEKQITKLLQRLTIWQWLNFRKDSALPPIKGFGPAVGGSVISEIGDIHRFATPEALRAYARFHINQEGKFPHRKAGEFSPWNRYLSRAVWLWTDDQMPRYDHPWRLLYDWKKARELQAHTEVKPRKITDKRGRPRTVYDFTLKHLDMRAKRWTGSQVLNYLWALWQEVAQGRDPENWYRGSSWPAYFVKASQELEDGLGSYLENEIPKRRRQEPKEETEEESEE